MFEKVINSKTKQILAEFGQNPKLKNFYLAGGTGLALQLGHRISVDLDFFSKDKFEPELLIHQIKGLGDFSLQSQDWGTVHAVLNEIKITFLYYDYLLLFSFKQFQGVSVADELDIACMKLGAIAARGSKKDFIDLYFLCQKIELKEILKLFVKKYKEVNFEITHLFKSLCYFEQAEKEPLPKMLKEASWERIKIFFQKEVRDLKLF